MLPEVAGSHPPAEPVGIQDGLCSGRSSGNDGNGTSLRLSSDESVTYLCLKFTHLCRRVVEASHGAMVGLVFSLSACASGYLCSQESAFARVSTQVSVIVRGLTCFVCLSACCTVWTMPDVEPYLHAGAGIMWTGSVALCAFVSSGLMQMSLWMSTEREFGPFEGAKNAVEPAAAISAQPGAAEVVGLAHASQRAKMY